MNNIPGMAPQPFQVPGGTISLDQMTPEDQKMYLTNLIAQAEEDLKAGQVMRDAYEEDIQRQRVLKTAIEKIIDEQPTWLGTSAHMEVLGSTILAMKRIAAMIVQADEQSAKVEENKKANEAKLAELHAASASA